MVETKLRLRDDEKRMLRHRKVRMGLARPLPSPKKDASLPRGGRGRCVHDPKIIASIVENCGTIREACERYQQVTGRRIASATLWYICHKNGIVTPYRRGYQQATKQ
jgi:hypothetical protein